jgi:predicted metal-dependent hydrolase
MIQKLKQKLRFGTDIIEYSIIKSSRIKTSEIIIDKGQIIIRTPYKKPVSEIKEIVRSKAGWILKKQLEYKRSNAETAKPTFEEGSMLPYLGSNYPLRIINEHRDIKVELGNGEFLIRRPNDSKKQVKNLYEEWLMQKSKSIFNKKVKTYSKELGVEAPLVIIKNLKNRWGSATKDNVINLNVNLLKTPHDVINYIILHELCHLKIKEHSHHFWDLLHKFTNYQDKINWLNDNGNVLI